MSDSETQQVPGEGWWLHFNTPIGYTLIVFWRKNYYYTHGLTHEWFQRVTATGPGETAGTPRTAEAGVSGQQGEAPGIEGASPQAQMPSRQGLWSRKVGQASPLWGEVSKVSSFGRDSVGAAGLALGELLLSGQQKHCHCWTGVTHAASVKFLFCVWSCGGNRPRWSVPNERCPLEETLPLPCILLDVTIIGPETQKSTRKQQKCSSAKPRGPSPPQIPPALPSPLSPSHSCLYFSCLTLFCPTFSLSTDNTQGIAGRKESLLGWLMLGWGTHESW